MLKKAIATIPVIFALMITGCSVSNRGAVSVTRFQERDVKTALASHSGTTSFSANEDIFQVPVPLTTLAIEFPKARYSAEIINYAKPYYFFTDEKTGVGISFNFERAPAFCNNSRSCRDFFVKKRLSLHEDNQGWMWQVNDVFVSEWWKDAIPEHRHMNAHFVKDGIWIDLHWSKGNFREEDRALFVDLVRSINFTSILSEK